jgi:transcriptional regulator with GAF, ATPase, and Fis domain
MSDDPLATVTRMSPPSGRRAEPGAALRVVHPAGLQWSATLGAGTVVIGRTASSDTAAPLRHDTVSRSHFEIRWDADQGAHLGRDLDSHNGSRVDGAALGTQAAALRDQAVVQLGDVTLVYDPISTLALTSDAAIEIDNCPGRSQAAMALRSALSRTAGDPSPVLLIGETGTGKEFPARELHARSGRKGPMLSINCAALSAQIIDSQLFGHVRGAFTGAATDSPGMFRAADGGTLFLDEIGELPLELQPKLLRALQEGEVQPVGGNRIVKVDVRVVAATNRELDRAVDAGAFRRDLYARLSLMEIRLPALRERRADLFDWIARLHRAWLDRRSDADRSPLSFDPEVAEVLLLHGWASNLREVDRLVHGLAAHMPAGELVGRSDLPTWFVDPESGDDDSPPPAPKRAVPSREEFAAEFERKGGNVRALAKHFDRDRRQIYRWIDSYGLRRDGGGGS